MHNRRVPPFPSMKQSKLLAILNGLGYDFEDGGQSTGSHRKLTAPGRRTLIWAFHKGVEIPPGLVRKILVKDVGLTIEEAERLVGTRRKS